jgi:hypothetical protein
MDDAEPPRRPGSLAEMKRLQARFFKPDEFGASIKAYRPRPTDIVISPFGKCGTTWLQQTFHTLRTRGDMDFDDISRVVPWIETSVGCGIDLEGPQRAEPRGFKSHLAYEPMPKGARYVVSLRDPKDAMVSVYRFMEGWFFEPGAISMSEFVADRMADAQGGSGYWNHLLSWWKVRHEPNVLLLSYEQMSAEPEAHIRRLAAFCGIELDEALLALTLERSSLAFMLAHKDRFDDAMMRRLSEERCGLPPGGDSAKVRAGKVGSHRHELAPETAAALDARWTEVVTSNLGFADYAALEAALRAGA